jgi:hypothetical protein
MPLPSTLPLTLRSMGSLAQLLGPMARIASSPWGPTVPLTRKPVAVVYRARPFTMWSGPARRLGHDPVCPFLDV